MKIAWLYTCSNHCSCPAHGCGRRTDHRNLEISRTQKFFQTYEKPRTTKYNQLQWCDSRQVCHFRPMTNGRYYNAVTVSSFVEAKNIHGNIDPVTSQYRLLPRKRHPRTPTLTQLGRPKRKKPNIFFFLFSLCISFIRSQNWRQP